MSTHHTLGHPSVSFWKVEKFEQALQKSYLQILTFIPFQQPYGYYYDYGAASAKHDTYSAGDAKVRDNNGLQQNIQFTTYYSSLCHPNCSFSNLE